MQGPDDLRRDLAARVTIERRQFLGLLAAGTGTLVLGACADDDAPNPTTTTNGDDTTTTVTTKVPGPQGITSDPFTLGVASGDPLPDSVILWTRLAPKPLDEAGDGGMAADDVEVLWEVATDEAFATPVASGIEVATGEFGHSIHAEPTGLESDTWYWYRFRVGSFTSPAGRTRTMAEAGAEVDLLKIAFASCQLRTKGHWTAYDHLVADEPDLVFFLGDYIYEYPGGEGALAVPLDAEPQTLADYRVLYAGYKQDLQLQRAHAAAPWVVTADDHEVENNYAGEIPDDPDDAATFAARRTAAYQALWEHQPLRLDPPDDRGAFQLYRTVSYGDLATFFVLDGRQYRTDQVCGDEIPTSKAECAELEDEDHTMLGTEQEAWLTSGLTKTKATWPVLAQQTVMKALVLGDLVLNVDQWDGYPAARRRLLTTIADNEIENVMVLTGDIHAGGAADIRLPDATQSGAVVAHELVGPGISSSGIAALGDAIGPEALGLAYVNSKDNGYVRCTITPTTWTTEFVVVDTIETPSSPASVAATVVVTAGTPGMTRT